MNSDGYHSIMFHAGRVGTDDGQSQKDQTGYTHHFPVRKTSIDVHSLTMMYHSRMMIIIKDLIKSTLI